MNDNTNESLKNLNNINAELEKLKTQCEEIKKRLIKKKELKTSVTAYLVVTCDGENRIIDCEIWSVSPWEATINFKEAEKLRQYVVYSVQCSCFQDGMDYIENNLINPENSKYRHLKPFYYNEEDF